MTWALSRTDSFVRQARKLIKKDPLLRKPVEDTFRQLLTNPRHPSLRIKRLQSVPDKWEASVNMDIRIIFTFEGTTIVLVAIGHHDDVLP